jgi:NAD(P)-dependent dehydrogenase (short-subunit alcohol dehydrogenase family)
MKILITGGASGLGKYITHDLLKNTEHEVFFTYSNSQKSAKEITSNFKNSKALKCDFTNIDDVDALCEKIKNFDIDVLINNAYCGNFISKHFNKTEIEEFRSNFEDNIIPTIKITQAALTIFKKNKSGKIITILSEALVNKSPIGTSVYTANKAYLKQLSKSWATENIKYNITSNTISPSFMRTNLTRDLDNRLIEKMVDDHPLKNILIPEDVTDTVSYLISASNHLNGVDIVLNAGQNLQ